LTSTPPIDVILTHHRRHFARLFVMWLIALVLPLQTAAVGVFAALGPAHIHQQLSAKPLVLHDFRRGKLPPAARQHVFASLGHFHADTSVARHRHAADDASVVAVHDDGVDGSGESAGGNGLSLFALAPALFAWSAPPAATSAIEHARWQPLAGFTVPIERPPRRS
jgi:hypothetical protein